MNCHRQLATHAHGAWHRSGNLADASFRRQYLYVADAFDGIVAISLVDGSVFTDAAPQPDTPAGSFSLGDLVALAADGQLLYACELLLLLLRLTASASKLLLRNCAVPSWKMPVLCAPHACVAYKSLPLVKGVHLDHYWC